ncbi:hypothetical protein [Amycolatopsis sp. cmx-11-51]|uniref:hypothetical protein n=1 Tax=Amycolatopsis sp. cmx-11-51 TaxID=2785797 RepID=UPI0039E38149
MANDVFPELQALAARLIAMPPVEAGASALPTVYGYVWAEHPKPAYIEACADVLTWWSVARGLRLSVVFRDIGLKPDALIRPGFTAATDVLQLPDVDGLLVLTRRHLSTEPSVADRLALEVRRTGTTLRVLTDELGEADS